MSLVSIVFGRNFISAVSDGRGSNDNNIVSENVQKICKVNSKTIIAFTGAFTVMERNGQQYYLYEDIIALAEEFFRNNTVKNAMKQISDYIKENWSSEKFGNFQIAIVSLVENGNRDTLSLHTNNNPKDKYEIDKIKADKQISNVILTYQIGDKAKKMNVTFIANLEKSIANLEKSTLSDLSNVIEASQNEQVKLNHRVSTYDDSVNNNVYRLVLKRN